MKARIKFRKYGSLRFIGHLDVMRFFQKVMRRADIPIAFSGGYSPHMIMSFANPLGIGLTSDGEYFDIEFNQKQINSADAVRRMNEACQIEGVEICKHRRIAEEKKMTGMTNPCRSRLSDICEKGSISGGLERTIFRIYGTAGDPNRKADKTKREGS